MTDNTSIFVIIQRNLVNNGYMDRKGEKRSNPGIEKNNANNTTLVT